MPRGVYVRTQQTREKIRQGMKGKTPWNKGKRSFIVPWNKGKKMSAETKRKVSETKRGQHRKMTDQEKQKLSEYNKRIGRKPPVVRFFGASHPNWKGGTTPINKRIRGSLEYRLWRKAVLERDKFQCVWGGEEHGTFLNVDHIKPFAYYPELRFAIDNGRTLCVECHKTTDTYGGRSKRIV